VVDSWRADGVTSTFYERPILNSPYAKPTAYHPLDQHGQPLELPPVAGRRPSKFLVPVPKAKRKGGATQGMLDLETYDDNGIINEIRSHVDTWRELPGGADWGVTPTTQRLLEHWRNHPFANQRPFFCQIEAIETLIWLTEVARTRRQYAHLWRSIIAANAEANPELIRLAMKMATGAGKTTVMAMVIAWQVVNAVRSPTSDRLSKAFLIVTPGITIRDRLKVLNPENPESYYRSREIVPNDMMADLGKAAIIITDYHAFQHRETLELSKVGRAFLRGNDRAPVQTRETDGQMLERACGKLLSFKNVIVINVEAHHCYRERTVSEEDKLDRDALAEARDNNEAARQLRGPCVAFLGVLLLVTDAQPPGLCAGAGPGDEPAECQGSVRRVAQLLGHHGRPERQDGGAIDADRGRCGGHRRGPYRLAR
jgi:type III restriction enzyme